jgi:hypothetical protein
MHGYVSCTACGNREVRPLPDGRLPFHYSAGPGVGLPCFGPTETPAPAPKEISQ